MLKSWLRNEPRPTGICVLLSLAALIFSLSGAWTKQLSLDPAWLAVICCGVPIILEALTALITKLDITADLLVSLALAASLLTGEYFAAGEVALIMQIGSLLEDYTANRAQKGVASLIKLTPRTARVIKNGQSITVPVENICIGDILQVLAGETIPVDGFLLSGHATLNQAVMTGESLPVDKIAGDPLLSGTQNQYQPLEMQASKTSGNSSLQRLLQLAAAADANKAPIVKLADRWASYLVLAALACAIITYGITGIFLRAVTVLVVICPCAFVLATPTAVAAAIGNLTRYGILIRTGAALERLAGVTTVAFDKTGTLTYGQPHILAVQSLNTAYSPEAILKLAATAEQKSEHPLGKAIVNSYARTGQTLPPVQNCLVWPGQGLEAESLDLHLRIGKAEFFKFTPHVKETALQYLNQGATVIFLEVNGNLAGLLALADVLRTDACTAIQALQSQTLETLLLTGDNAATAATIASATGIKQVKSNLLPEEKLTVIKDYLAARKKICMVGDGINDAPALRNAYAGIAMGGIGSDVAVQAADAVLVQNNLQRLPYLFYMARKAMFKVKQNIYFSLGINFLAVLLSFTGILTPITGALFHNCGSVFVVINAALLLREKA